MSIPDDLQRLHTPLHGFLAGAGALFAAFEFLTGLKRHERALLNRAAPGLYWLLLDALGDQVILQLARMLDPPSSRRGDKNLSFDRLQNALGSRISRSAGLSFKTHLNVAKRLAAGMIERRNKQLAHVDLPVAMGQRQATSTPFSMREMRQCLEELAACLNAVYSHYEGFSFPYEKPVPPYDETLRSLVRTLAKVEPG